MQREGEFGVTELGRAEGTHCEGSPWVVKFSCLQTTAALFASHKSSHTVPHWLSMHISTLPSFGITPSTSRTAPCGQVTLGSVCVCVCVYGRGEEPLDHNRPLSKHAVSPSPLQTTPASLLWSVHHRVNEGNPGRGQSTSLDSDPLQLSWFRKMGPSPPPNMDPVRALAPGSSQEKKNITWVPSQD